MSGRPTPSPQSHIKIADTIESKDVKPASTSAPGETPMTMAMRQASAEAAKKAGEKKTAQNEALKAKLATNQESADILPEAKTTQASATETARNLVEDTADKEHQKPTNTAQDTGEKLVDRGDVEKEMTTNVARNVEEAVPESKAEEATPKAESQQAQEDKSGMTSTSSLAPDDIKGTTTQHRGSVVAEAAPEEIEEVERGTAIPEAEEDNGIEGGEDKPQPKSTDKPQTEDSSISSKQEGREESIAIEANMKGFSTTALKDVTASTEAEKPAPEGGETQSQEAREGDAAGASVGD